MVLRLHHLYQRLFEEYGAQGWWPLNRLAENQKNPTERGRHTWYHPNDYSPLNGDDAFEMMVGAILTQNTSWENADKAIGNLIHQGLLSVPAINSVAPEILAEIIRPSGYYNQKAKKLKSIAQFLTAHPIAELRTVETEHLRKDLLAIFGVGPETADSILLYGFNRLTFVVDAYSKRLLSRLGLCPLKPSYSELQGFFHAEIEGDVAIYNEFHALIVQHCVRICKKKPNCADCFLAENCPKIMPAAPSMPLRRRKRTDKKFRKK